VNPTAALSNDRDCGTQTQQQRQKKN
jgi:hypothetical protein